MATTITKKLLQFTKKAAASEWREVIVGGGPTKNLNPTIPVPLKKFLKVVSQQIPTGVLILFSNENGRFGVQIRDKRIDASIVFGGSGASMDDAFWEASSKYVGHFQSAAASAEKIFDHLQRLARDAG